MQFVGGKGARSSRENQEKIIITGFFKAGNLSVPFAT
jgi:hypothetical protein